MTDTDIPANNSTDLAGHLAEQGVAEAGSNAPNSTCADDNDNDSTDDEAPPRKRLRPEHSNSSADYIPPFTQGAVGKKYVVVKGIKPGIYSDWWVEDCLILINILTLNLTNRNAYLDQVHKVPGHVSRSFQIPSRAWDYYESNRQSGNLECLTRPPGVPPYPDMQGSMVSLENPWPEDASAFVVIRGLNPGAYNSWLVLAFSIVSTSSLTGILLSQGRMLSQYRQLP